MAEPSVGGALTWLSEIIQWLGEFIPRWIIIRTTHGGVKFVRGKRVVVLYPGIRWYWPIVTELITYPTARQTTPLRAQTLTTIDGKVVAVGGMIVYEIEDIEKLLAHSYDADQTIEDLALTAISAVVNLKLQFNA